MTSNATEVACLVLHESEHRADACQLQCIYKMCSRSVQGTVLATTPMACLSHSLSRGQPLT